MKRLIITVVSAIALASNAWTDTELRDTPAKDMSPEMAAAALDWAITNANYAKIVAITASKKVDLETVVDKTVGKIPVSIARDVIYSRPDVTNYVCIAKYINAENIAKPSDKYNLRLLVLTHGYIDTEDGITYVKKAYAANPLFGASMIVNDWYKDVRSPEIYGMAEDVFDAILKTAPADPSFNWFDMVCLMRYALIVRKDYTTFNALWNPKLLKFNKKCWIYPIITAPEAVKYNKDMAALAAEVENNDDQVLRFAKYADIGLGTKAGTDEIYSKLVKSSSKLSTALYLNDGDKIIDALTTCDTSLTAAEINAVIGSINAFDPDYKPAEVLKALRAVNQRYTLKLYEDRDTWEPVLSKIRAMIDCRR